jgi:hypothetical protein
MGCQGCAAWEVERVLAVGRMVPGATYERIRVPGRLLSSTRIVALWLALGWRSGLGESVDPFAVAIGRLARWRVCSNFGPVHVRPGL